jgi:uncharacterized membrane protein
VTLPTGATGGILESVSCPSGSACTATGSVFANPGGTWAVRWNGVRWSTQATPNPPNLASSTSQVVLSGVSCSTGDGCVAVGNYTPNNQPTAFIEAWPAGRWRLQAAAPPAGSVTDYLGSAFCSARCTAVGGYSGLTGLTVTMAMAANAP